MHLSQCSYLSSSSKPSVSPHLFLPLFARTGLWRDPRSSPPLFLLPFRFPSYFWILGRGFQSLRLHPVSLSSPSLARHGSRLVGRERSNWGWHCGAPWWRTKRSNKVGFVGDASLLTPSLGLEQWATWYALATTSGQTPHMQTAAINFPLADSCP